MGSFLKSLKSKIRPDDDDIDDDQDDSAENDQDYDGRARASDDSSPSESRMRAPVDDDDLTDGMEPESISGSGKQIVNGHLIVDGADMGAVDNSSITSMDDVLAYAKVEPTIHVPEDVFLPEDMDGIKFDGERDGFSKKQVAEFFEKAKASSEYLKKIIEARHDDIYSLAKYAKHLNEQIQDSKMMNDVARASGMAVIAGDDDNRVMELTEENNRLKAQLKNASSGAAAEQSTQVQNLQDQLSELKDRYSSIQDQLGREQYTNKHLSDEISEMRLKLDARNENEHDDIDNLTVSISSMDDGDDETEPEARQTGPSAKPQKSLKPVSGNQPHAGHRLKPTRTASGTQKKRLSPSKTSLHPSKGAEQKHRQVSLKPSGTVKMPHTPSSPKKDDGRGRTGGSPKENDNAARLRQSTPQQPGKQKMKPARTMPKTEETAGIVRASSEPSDEDSKYISFD